MTTEETPHVGKPVVHDTIAELLVPIEGLQHYDRNPRRGDVAAIAESLAVNGQYRPIVINRRSQQVLAGNHTLQAARQLGWTHIAATWVDVDEEQAARIVLVDNRSNDLAGYDDRQLLDLLQSLPDLAGTGYDAAALAALLAGDEEPVALTDPDDVPDIPERPVSVLGDVWQLGPHRLVIGDATQESSAQAALAGQAVDVLWTDPPYGVAYQGKTADKLTIANDDLSAAQLGELLDGAFTVAHQVLRPGGAFYICTPSGALETTFRLALDTAHLPLRTQIVWVKDQFVLGRADYHGQHETILYGWRLDGEPQMPPHYDPEHETILYGWKPGSAHAFHGGRKQSTVWECPRPRRSADHPTMKPVELVRRAVENSSQPGGRVLDLFAGSGSTLIACHAARRTAALVELDPRYGDVICRRYQEHTGIVPILERIGRAHDFTTGNG